MVRTSVLERKTMKTNELSIKERTGRRANWEAFSFGVCPNGVVNVQNNSYGDDATHHTYSVDPVPGRSLIDNGCSCPTAKYRDGPCKHQLAVRNNAAVMLAAETAAAETELAPTPACAQSVRADGGIVASPIIEAPDDGEILDDDEDDEDAGGESDTDQQKLRSATHAFVLDAYEASPLPDFDGYQEIVDCATDSVFRTVIAETGGA
jgi:hypothetical protein